LKFSFGAVCLFVAAVILGTFVPRPLFSAQADVPKEVAIYVASNPIHTDIIIPADSQTRSTFAFLADALPLDNPNVEWIIFGWGGRSFYIETPTWSAMRPEPLLRALTLDAATMHVELLGGLNKDNPSLIELRISKENLAKLRAAMFSSFKVDTAGKPQLIKGAAYGNYDQFYEANGYFNALVGCNTWTARMLRVAGLRTGLWNPFPQSLRLSLNLHN
jgi:uncharacterized protein (TIGR02117 family)